MSKRTQLFVLTALLTALALFARLHRLDVLAFYGDEETTALPARSLAEGGEAAMPSGMLYRRALYMTWLNAAWARALGTSKELPYRLTSALLGALAVPLLFLWSRRWIGTTAALIAGLLFALSVFMLSHSREARMYAALALFMMCTALAAWRWAETGRWRDFGVLVASFTAAAATHHGAILIVPLVFLPAMVRPGTKRNPLVHVGAAVALIAAEYCFHLWTKAPYGEWQIAGVPDPVRQGSTIAFFQGPLNKALLALGAALGAFAAWRGNPDGDTDQGAWLRVTGRVVLGSACGAFAFGGQAFGAGCAFLLFMLIHDGERKQLWRRTWPFALAFAVVIAGRMGLAVVSQGVGAGVRSGFQWPYPTAIWMGAPFPGVYALMMAAIVWLALTRPRAETNFLRYCAIGFFVPVLVVGADHRYAPMRYVIGSYPLLVILASAALAAILRRVARREVWVGAIGAVIVASGVLGGHGLPQTWRLLQLDYGDPLDEMTFGFPFYPDHGSTGRYVAAHLRPGDRVVAEDMLEQRWYAGQVDYWLHTFKGSENFIHRDKEGVFRDIYVLARALREGDTHLLAPRPDSRVWLITSGEISYRREMFLSPDQLEWLAEVERTHEPVFEGRDGAGKVYLLEAAR